MILTFDVLASKNTHSSQRVKLNTFDGNSNTLCGVVYPLTSKELCSCKIYIRVSYTKQHCYSMLSIALLVYALYSIVILCPLYSLTNRSV